MERVKVVRPRSRMTSSLCLTATAEAAERERKLQLTSVIEMLCVTLSLLCWASLALALPAPAPDEDRMVQPLSAAASGNYTISFMPLLSVLVNMFPRIMSRMRIQPLTGTPQSRKLEALWEWEQASLCAMIESSAWTSHNNPCYFYSCRLNKKSDCKDPANLQERGLDSHSRDIDTVILMSTAVDDCTTLELRRCSDTALKYDTKLRRCYPMSQQEQQTCRQTKTPVSLYT